MKQAVLIFFCLISYSDATEISFIGPCNKKPILTSKTELSDESSNVGSYTLKVLEELSIPYVGSEHSIQSMFNTPIGEDSIEVISDVEMKAYGWCFSVNGFEPASYPNEIKLKQNDQILWWFGYAHYKNGKWITQCTPSFTSPPRSLCPNL